MRSVGHENDVSRVRDADTQGGEILRPIIIPSAETINALPEPIRDYIHQLETHDVDPQGDIRALWEAREQVRQLTAKIAEMAQRPLPGCSECGWNDVHSPQCRHAGTAAPSSDGAAGAGVRELDLEPIQRRLDTHYMHVGSDHVQAPRQMRQDTADLLTEVSRLRTALGQPQMSSLCVTCGHSLATHDSGPSEDGCRFQFGWGHECECGWPVSALPNPNNLALQAQNGSSDVE